MKDRLKDKMTVPGAEHDAVSGLFADPCQGEQEGRRAGRDLQHRGPWVAAGLLILGHPVVFTYC